MNVEVEFDFDSVVALVVVVAARLKQFKMAGVVIQSVGVLTMLAKSISLHISLPVFFETRIRLMMTRKRIRMTIMKMNVMMTPVMMTVQSVTVMPEED